MALEALREIVHGAIERHGLCAAAAEHRVGACRSGEPSVLVAASAAHRGEAFAGAREIIDAIKARAPIWKVEVDGGERTWVEGTSPGRPPGGTTAPARQAPAPASALAGLLAREPVLGEHRVLARALDDGEQVAHRGDLLDLLLDEPLHELLAGVVAVLARGRGERVDLLRHALLLVERELHRLDDVGEPVLRRLDARGSRGSTPWSSRYWTIIIAWPRSSSAWA